MVSILIKNKITNHQTIWGKNLLHINHKLHLKMLKELEVVSEMKSKMSFICRHRKISMGRIFFLRLTNWDTTNNKPVPPINHRNYNLLKMFQEQMTFYLQDIIRITVIKNKVRTWIIMIFLLLWFLLKTILEILQMISMGIKSKIA